MTAVAGGRARLLIDGQWQAGTGAPLEVVDKYTGAVIGTVESAGCAAALSCRSGKPDPRFRCRRPHPNGEPATRERRLAKSRGFV